jgi:hypothetical protein
MGSLPPGRRGVNAPVRLPNNADVLLVAAHAMINSMSAPELAALILHETHGEAIARPALRLAAVRLAMFGAGVPEAAL